MISEHARGYAEGHAEVVRRLQNPTVEMVDAVGNAIDEAWNGSGSDGRPNDLPPIELTDHERCHLALAAIAALVPTNTPREGGDG